MIPDTKIYRLVYRYVDEFLFEVDSESSPYTPRIGEEITVHNWDGKGGSVTGKIVEVIHNVGREHRNFWHNITVNIGRIK